MPERVRAGSRLLAGTKALALLLTMGSACSGAAAAAVAGASPAPVVLLEIEGPIGPAISDYVHRGLGRSAEMAAQAVILRLDTPGGLDMSMREIVRAILASPVPVVAFVAPSGARAASAGTYIVYASHVAAMAPGTNLGAATPVQLGSPLPEAPGSGDNGARDSGDGNPPGSPPGLAEKSINDGAAYIRSLAQLRGRNVEWAGQAVRSAATLTADEALRIGVINLIAPDVPSLLMRLDRRDVALAERTVQLATAGAPVVTVAADWRTRLLSLITDPNVASLLMLIGVFGVILELSSPGLIGPGVAGAICILLALYAFHVLPVDYGGLALLLFGVALMVAEVFVGSFGVLGAGGLAAFVIGAILLMRDDAPGFTVAWQFLGPAAAVAGLAFIALSALVLRARHRPVVTGPEQLAAGYGEVLDWSGNEGRIRVHGEAWQARSRHRLNPGQRVRVTALDGLTLEVEPAQQEER